MVTESYDYEEVEKTMMYYGTPLVKESDFPFNFYLLDLPQNASGLWAKHLVDLWMSNMPRGKWPNWVVSRTNISMAFQLIYYSYSFWFTIPASLAAACISLNLTQVGNHDRSRIASSAGKMYVRVINMLLLTLPGTPTTYYGEEIGMENINITADQVQDPFGKYNLVSILLVLNKTKSAVFWIAFIKNIEKDYVSGCQMFTVLSVQSNSRDPQRSPMQWNSDMNTGFNNLTNVTWLPVHPDYKSVNVEVRSFLRTKQTSDLNGLKFAFCWSHLLSNPFHPGPKGQWRIHNVSV